MIGDLLSQVLEFLAHVGGFLALLFFIVLGVKLWKQDDETQEKEFEDDV